MINAYSEDLDFTIPTLTAPMSWESLVDTAEPTGRVADDGIIDPRDTRTVLAMALSACHSGPVQGARGYGVFRL